MREIVHVQAGQCGNQIGSKVRNIYPNEVFLELLSKVKGKFHLNVIFSLTFLSTQHLCKNFNNQECCIHFSNLQVSGPGIYKENITYYSFCTVIEPLNPRCKVFFITYALINFCEFFITNHLNLTLSYTIIGKVVANIDFI